MSGRVDPRIRERRITVKRAQGRRRLRILGVLVALVLVGFVAFGISRSPILAVNTIVVTGATQTEEEAILDAAGIDDGDPLLWTDLGAAERRIEELPWIATASVKRDLPRTVRIEVTERSAIAWVRGPETGGAAPVGLVDADGRLLEVVSEAPPLPEVLGPVFDEFVAGATSERPAAVEVLAAIPPDLATRVAAVIVSDDGNSVVVTLVDGPDLHMGDTADIPTKSSAALAVLAALGDDPVAVVDVSVPLAPTTRQVGEPTDETPAMAGDGAENVDPNPSTG